MSHYDEIIQAARLKAEQERARAAAAEQERADALSRRLSELRRLFDVHARPEFDAACDALRRNGCQASVEIGESIAESTRLGVMRIALSVGGFLPDHVLEISGTAADAPLSCRIKTLSSDSSAGQLDPGGDLREFARLSLASFLTTIPFQP